MTVAEEHLEVQSSTQGMRTSAFGLSGGCTEGAQSIECTASCGKAASCDVRILLLLAVSFCGGREDVCKRPEKVQ